MLFDNRDLGILAGGAIGAVLALLLPLPLWGRMVVGLSILVAGMLLALLRVGPDRVPLEKWLKRRLRFAFKTRRYVYHRHRPKAPEEPAEPAAPRESEPAPAAPLVFDFDEVGVELLASAAMAVLGLYTVVWLQAGGAEEVARVLNVLVSSP